MRAIKITTTKEHKNMKTNKTFFITSSAVIMAVFSMLVCCDYANAASRVAVRGALHCRGGVFPVHDHDGASRHAGVRML